MSIFRNLCPAKPTKGAPQKALILPLILFLALFVLPRPAAQAQTIVWSGLGDGSTWGDDANWTGGVEPTASNSINLSSATVIVNSVATFSTPVSGSLGTINVNNGGDLTAASSPLRYLTAVNVNNGGKLTTGATMDVRSTVTIASGGEMTGSDSIFDGKGLSIGGVFKPLGTTSGTLLFRIGSATTIASVTMQSTGELHLDLFGNGINEYFSIDDVGTVDSTLDLSVGSIVLNPQGYTPQIGDTFDLWNDLATGSNPNNVTPGTGANITLPGYTLDVSNWATNGTVTVVIPEPTTISLLAFAGCVLLLRRRRAG